MLTYTNKFEKWFQKGLKNGWITDIVCDTHDGLPLTDEEYKEFDEGGDPCVPVVRILID